MSGHGDHGEEDHMVSVKVGIFLICTVCCLMLVAL
jgi:hypothetical protein